MFIPALIISLRRSTERDAGPGTRDPTMKFLPNLIARKISKRLPHLRSPLEFSLLLFSLQAARTHPLGKAACVDVQPQPGLGYLC